MSPWLVTLLLVTGLGLFGFRLQWIIRLLKVQAPPSGIEWKVGLVRRLRRTFVEGVLQRKLHRYRVAGLAHHVVFFGFLVLLLRTFSLFVRAYVPGFLPFGSTQVESGTWDWNGVYRTVREYAAVLVVIAVAAFAYFRVVRRERRLTLSREGIVILAIIATMMVSDFVYDACGQLLAADVLHRARENGTPSAQSLAQFVEPFLREGKPPSIWAAPGSALVGEGVVLLPKTMWFLLGMFGYYLHVGLVITFLVLIPRSKHLHLLLALPNLFLSRVDETSALEPVAPNVEGLCTLVESAMERDELDVAPIGKARLEHWDAKSRLDWFACTECGRCSDHCPALRTNKPLDPKGVTLALREHLKAEAPRLFGTRDAKADSLVPNVIKPETVWACTTCRACEEQCPVGVHYLDTIVGIRRNLVMMRGEVPRELTRAFDGIERNHNPWNFPKCDRSAWAEGLNVPLMAQTPEVDVLYWVGCAASYDERAKAVARSFVRLMRRAKINFAILGPEERCTGESARKAGNELLFLQLAEENIATLNRYRDQGRFARIVTTCPHCLTTLKKDYADFGGHYEVVSHVTVLEQWVHSGRLRLRRGSEQRVTFHDPCTLARGAGITDAPRRLLEAIPGVSLKEPDHHGRQTLCCGAGGAQLWLEEQNQDRMNVKRAGELLNTGATCITSACPFCLTMVSDGVKALELGAQVRVADLTELVERALDDAFDVANALGGSSEASELPS